MENKKNTINHSLIKEVKKECGIAAGRTEQWMLDHLEINNLFESSYEDPVKYYKWPLTLSARQRKKDAEKLLQWIINQSLTENGDLISERSGFHKEFHFYANCWLLLAAVELKEAELAEKLLGFLRLHLNERTGGVATRPETEVTIYSEDPLTSSFLGLVAVEINDKVLADNILNYLIRWIDQQIQKDYLWLRTSGEGSFLQNIPIGADPKTWKINIGETGESYYFLGAICYFLANYYSVFGNKEIFGLANRIVEILESAGESALSSIWAAKVAPGCTALYSVSGAERYLTVAMPVIKTILKIQDKKGYWIKDNQPWITVSAEQCYWLNYIFHRL